MIDGKMRYTVVPTPYAPSLRGGFLSTVSVHLLLQSVLGNMGQMSAIKKMHSVLVTEGLTDI